MEEGIVIPADRIDRVRLTLNQGRFSLIDSEGEARGAYFFLPRGYGVMPLQPSEPERSNEPIRGGGAFNKILLLTDTEDGRLPDFKDYHRYSNIYNIDFAFDVMLLNKYKKSEYNQSALTAPEEFSAEAGSKQIILYLKRQPTTP
jgi:hypothetical protein